MVISKSDGLYGRFVRVQTRIDFSIKVKKKTSLLPKIYIGLWYSITVTLQRILIYKNSICGCACSRDFLIPKIFWNFTPLVHSGLTINNIYIHFKLLFRFLWSLVVKKEKWLDVHMYTQKNIPVFPVNFPSIAKRV